MYQRGLFTSLFVVAETIYRFCSKFITLVLGSDTAVTPSEAENVFLDTLCDEVGADIILPHITNEEWRRQIGEKTIKPIINDIQSAIGVAEATRGKGITARYNAGVKLMKQAQQLLPQLKAFLPTTDVQYQMIADKLGLTILQCGIDYFNDSEAADAPRNAMKLQRYALSIVVGKMAKDRCNENVDILQKIIDNLPPSEVFAEDRAVHEELKKFCELPDKIIHAVTLLNNTRPHLQSMKQKLGINNSHYLKLSTQVVGNALHNVIEEVNMAQNDPSLPFDFRLKAVLMKPVFRSAWETTLLMDTFDMESDFKTNRYNPNRNTLKRICEQLDIYTPPEPKYMTSPRTDMQTQQSTTTNTSSKQSAKSDDGYSWGCIIPIVIGIIIFLIYIISE